MTGRPTELGRSFFPQMLMAGAFLVCAPYLYALELWAGAGQYF